METEEKTKFSIFHFLKPYRKVFIIACLCIVIENFLEISIPFLMNILLKKGMSETSEGYVYNLPFVLIIGSIMLTFALVAFFLGLISAKTTAICGRGLGYELRKEEYKKIQAFSFSNLDEFRLNSLVTRMSNDVQIISDTFCQVLRPLLRAPFQLLFALIFAFIISKDLSIVFAVVIPILAIILTLIVMFSKPKFYKLQTSLDSINRVTDESLIAMKLVRANAKKDYEIEKFSYVNKEVKDVGTSALSLVALNMGVMQLMIYSASIGILLLGGLGVFNNWHPTQSAISEASNIASFLSYATQTLNSLMMLSNVFMSFTRASASLVRIKEVFSSKSEIIEKKDSTLKVRDGSIEFKNVYFKYKNDAPNYVLENINFKIKSGETIGILGETGSSKSTLIYLIERFYDINQGEILISNNDIKDYRLNELRDQIAISFQKPILFAGTVKENLLWGNKNASDEEIIKACEIACAHSFIVNSLSSGYDTYISQGGNNVSGGQRQRICIARALLKKPKILILDDSFSALDGLTEKTVKENLKNNLPDMTKIIISQKISSIEDADRIIVLNAGKINNINTSAWLLENDPIYQDVYRIQKEGSENETK